MNCQQNEILSSLNVIVKEDVDIIEKCRVWFLFVASAPAPFNNHPKQSRGAIKPEIFPTIKLTKPIIVLKSEIIDIPPRMLAIMLQSPISCYQVSLATQPLDCVGRDIYIIPFSFERSMPFPAFCM